MTSIQVSEVRAAPATERGARERQTLGVDGRPRLIQLALPSLRQVMRSPAESEFAHPAERDLARLLSYYRIRWVYEPTTFAVARGADGQPTELFTPDFYLPDHGLYLELTTMRQRLVTRKNRKLRLLRERYPNVRIKLLYRRDYLRLIEAYAAPRDRQARSRIGRILLGAEQIRARIAELAATVAATVMGGDRERDARPLLVLGVGRGSERFLGAMSTALGGEGLEVETDLVQLSRWRMPRGSGKARVQPQPGAALTGRRVLLVEDIVSTGLSLRYLLQWLRRRGVTKVETCALLDRPAARLVEVPIRYVGFEVPGESLIGYGLYRRREFCTLPFIATVEPA